MRSGRTTNMMMPKIALAVVNHELDGRTMEEARALVGLGKARWVRGPLATLKVVTTGYALADQEMFVEEVVPSLFIPESV
jgi:hypothetical protein